MDKSRVAIVIPAYNEESQIFQVIYSLLSYGCPIVVNDGSSDNTSEVSRLAGARVVDCCENQGYDNALNLGFFEAKRLGFEYVVTFDADGQHDIFSLQKIIEKLNAGWDLVIGRRVNYQRISELIFGKICNHLWGIGDPLCGMKGYAISLYDEIGHFDSYRSIGTEMMFYAILNNRAIIEVPVKERKRLGQSRFGGSFHANLKIFRAMAIGIANYVKCIFLMKYCR